MLNEELLNPKGNKFCVGGASGAAKCFYISELCRNNDKSIVVIAPDSRSATSLHEELTWMNRGKRTVLNFSDYETLPYDAFSPQQELVSNRLEALFGLLRAKNTLTVTSVQAAMGRLPPTDFVIKNALVISRGQTLPMRDLIDTLTQKGYSRVPGVYEQGEFAVRGSIIDLFASGQDRPYRIDYFDDDIDSIKAFDPETQRSSEEIESLRLLPAREFPIQPQDIETFRRQYRDAFGASLDADSVYQRVSSGRIPAGIESYIPLFHESTATLADYLPKDAIIVFAGDIPAECEKFFRYAESRRESNIEPHELLARPRLPVTSLWQRPDEFMGSFKEFTAARLSNETTGKLNIGTEAFPDICIGKTGTKASAGNLKNFAENFSGRILFSAYSLGRTETIIETLAPLGIKPQNFRNEKEFEKSEERFGLIVSPIDEGAIIGSGDTKLAFITESELFGATFASACRKSKKIQADAVIRNLAELRDGDPIVHYRYGIGLYRGLEIRDISGVNKEFFCLEYADNAKLYVEVTELHQISRYTGGSSPKISTLGSDAWEKNRAKAQQKVRDAAAGLLDIYSKRAMKTGFVFSIDKKAYAQFCQGFPYDETEDQKRAIEAVISDMTSLKTMDRLVCGDVGFGKTEVAIRAAYIAATNGKQVAVLVPTVLLAEQHFESFRERLSGEAIAVETLSRFKTAGEQKVIKQQLAEGKIDVIIGTHKLLSKEIAFKDLGLLIVDEEHRFGVRHKEAIKSLRADVDILTMTATPIPRTLNMAFSGIRDLSLITTPPARRLAVKTFLRQRDPQLVREAITRELNRGGQVYYLHNDVADIDMVAEDLANLVPNARVAVAHGQMAEKSLGTVMNEFYRHKFDVLVCTTIIETGIDVPAANTIIIDDADKFGLAQLHQIRGRVGRSAHQAYAYLLTKNTKALKADAIKRLEAITRHDALGVGFALANQDLEIRGAGEILGEEQSGQIAAVGFTLYMEMLDKAVKDLKEGKEPSLSDLAEGTAEINLNVSALLPPAYLGDVNSRLSFYKRLASAPDEDALRDIREELIDRYGMLPKETADLFEVTKIRIRCDKAGIAAITLSESMGFIRFSANTTVDPVNLISMLQQNPNSFKMADSVKLRIIHRPAPENRISFIQDVLTKLGV